MYQTILLKSLFLVLLVLVGILIRHIKLISDKGQEDLGKILVDILWPALILSSIAGQLSAKDITDNLLLPLSAVITFSTGAFIGIITSRMFHFHGDEKNIFIYQSAVNNFIYFPLIFVMDMIPGRGAGLLFIHNLGYTVMIWIAGVPVLQGSTAVSWPKRLKKIFSAGMCATLAGIVIVFLKPHVKISGEVTGLFFQVADTFGKATLPIAMIIAGVEIYKLGVKSLRFDRWNIALGAVKVIAAPALLFIIGLFLYRIAALPRTVIIIFMLVNIMPVSINSVSLCLRYTKSPNLAAQSVVFTHLFGILCMPLYIFLIEKFFMVN